MQLIVNTFGAVLRKQGERFLIRAGDKELAVSAHKVQSILVTTGVSLSSDALQLASEHNIDVVFLDRFGDSYGRFWQNRMGSTASIRRRQLESADGPEGLKLVRGWVEAKLRHQLEFLEELASRRPGVEADFQPAREGIRDCLGRLSSLEGTVEERRGTLMGTAKRVKGGMEGGGGRCRRCRFASRLPFSTDVLFDFATMAGRSAGRPDHGDLSMKALTERPKGFTENMAQ